MSMEKEIKRLNSLIKSCDADIEMYENIIKELRCKRNEATEKLQFFNQTPVMTDHAVLRYMERVMGVDVDSIRNKIFEPGVQSVINGGASRVTIDGLTFIVRNKAVVTLYEGK